MSDVLRGRLMLLATASVLGLAAFSWGSMASAQDMAEDPAAGGETSQQDVGFEGEVSIGDIYDGEVIDAEIPGDDFGGAVDEGEGSLIDPAETFPDDGAIEDPGMVEEGVVEDGETLDGEVPDGEVLDGGMLPEVDVMMQSGVPDMQAVTSAADPLAGRTAVARQSQPAADHDGNCAGTLKNKDCVAN